MSEPLAEGAYDPAATPVQIWAEGCKVTKIGTGQIAVDLQRATNAAHFTGAVTASRKATGSLVFSVEDTTDLRKTIWTTDGAGTLVDWPARFVFERKG